MREAGLITYWYPKGLADVHQCVHTKKKGSIDDMDPLSLKGLTGAFLVIISGSLMTILIFLREKIYFILSKRKLSPTIINI